VGGGVGVWGREIGHLGGGVRTSRRRGRERRRR
jgi:hypothetical protein